MTKISIYSIRGSRGMMGYPLNAFIIMLVNEFIPIHKHAPRPTNELFTHTPIYHTTIITPDYKLYSPLTKHTIYLIFNSYEILISGHECTTHPQALFDGIPLIGDRPNDAAMYFLTKDTKHIDVFWKDLERQVFIENI